MEDTVHRPTGPWTATVHDFLRHLRRSGFEGAPLPRGFDEMGREVLEFIPGDVLTTPQDSTQPVALEPWPAEWRTDEALVAVALLIRNLHEAAVGFHPSRPAWRMHDRPMAAGEIVCHGDLGPWNTVYRDGLPVALIDWDSAKPDHPFLDLASAAWSYIPLASTEDARSMGFDSVDYGGRLRVLLDGYGLKDRSAFIESLQVVEQRKSENLRYWNGITPEGAAGFLEAIASNLRWLVSRKGELESALG